MIVYPVDVVFVKTSATIFVYIDDKLSNVNKDNELDSIQITDTQENKLNKGKFFVCDKAYQMQ